jgi:hypothetical protein
LAERRTITVHALGDERIHLAPAHLGRLKQGRLQTLCGKMAVTRLSPFAAAAAKASDRCRVCFGKVDADGLLKAEIVKQRPRPAKAKPSADIIALVSRREHATAEPDSGPASEAPMRAVAATKRPPKPRTKQGRKRRSAEALRRRGD